MSRTSVTLREATAEDVPFLLELWGDVLRRGDAEAQVLDLTVLVEEADVDPEQRLVVAEHDGEPAGAVLMRSSTIGPLNLEPAVQVVAPHVLPRFRGRRIGRTLVEVGVAWAEELGIAHVTGAATASSRSGNRFMARLSFGPRAMQRVTTTHAARARLTALQPTAPRVAGRRPIGQVLAARRQLTRRPAEGPAGS